MGRFALDEAPERKRDALVESERRCPRAYRCSRASGVLSECVDSEGSLSSITSGSVVSAIPFASGDEGKECGGVSGMGVDDRLGSVLLTPVLQSSLSSSSHRADIRPEDLRERLLLLSPFARPGLRAGGGRSGGGGTATWKSAGNVLGFRRFEGDDAAGMRGGVSHRTSWAQSSSVYVSFEASSAACLRIVLAFDRAEEEEPTELAPADEARGLELDAIVMVSTDSDCLLPRSELAAVVGLVEVAGEGAEKRSSPPLVVEDATEDIDVSDGVRDTEVESTVSSS